MQLAEVDKNANEFKELGLNILGICPDTIDGLEEVASKSKITLPLFSDSAITTSEAFGLAFHVDDATVQLYLDKYNVDLEKASGHTHHNLPVPALYIVDANGNICFVHTDPDYTIRLSAEDLLKEARVFAKQK